MSKYYIGVDLGGTKILTALADKEGNILARKKLPTEAEKGREQVFNNIYKSIDLVLTESAIKKEDVQRIGVGCPGPLSKKEGIVYLAPNLGWENIPIVEIIEAKEGIATVLENDANAAALGEKVFGAGKGVANLIYVTVSTGIGGGIIINDKVYHGASDSAGEIGHMIIESVGPKCNCGNLGCFEALASGTAITKLGREAVQKQENTSLRQLSAGDINKIDSLMIEKAALAGDKLAQSIWLKAGNYLGIGLANLLNIFNPERVILGGGVMKAGDLIMKPMLKSLEKNSFESAFKAVEICQVALGDDTGVKGAIAVAMEG